MVCIRFQQPLDFQPHIMFDREQHHVGAFSPAIRHRPLHLDHAADTAQMLDELGPLAVRRMHDMDPQAAQITKNLDGHARISVPPRYPWTSGPNELLLVDRPVVEALDHTIGIGLHAHARIPDDLEAPLAVDPRDPRP